MATTIKAPMRWPQLSESKHNHPRIYNRFIAFTETQAQNKTQWFLFSLIFQGVFFLPLPAMLIYYYHAPLFILGITLLLFFANIIAGMSGANIKTIIQLLATSFITHLLLSIVWILF